MVNKTSYRELYQKLEKDCALAKPLYNAALFRLRNHYTARGKTMLTVNERQVENELATAGVVAKSSISRFRMDKVMRVNHIPDFFAGLPMQSAEQELAQACTDFLSWLKARAEYKKHPEKFKGEPRMPYYKKERLDTCYYTNQDCVLYDGFLKFPGIKFRLPCPQLKGAVLKQVTVKPCYGRFMVCVVCEVADIPKHKANGTLCIDLGVDNVAACVCTDGSSMIIKGGIAKSKNQWFNKEHARLISEVMKDNGHSSRRLDDLSYSRMTFFRDFMHKASRMIIDFAEAHNAGRIIIGVNKGWKQCSGIGDANNQNFVQMPLYMLRRMVAMKADAAGITVVEQEESYTSKADFLSGDYMPIYGIDDDRAHFSGKRFMRGLYRSGSGMVINADLNGAANIGRKAEPGLFDGLTDFSFLANPVVCRINKGIPVKRIGAA